MRQKLKMRQKLRKLNAVRKERRQQRHVARDITYSQSARSRSGQAFIRTMENVTGRPRLIRQVKGYEKEVAAGRDFWQVMVERYRLELDFLKGDFSKIPADGPLIVVANHPYGILDGLVLGYMLSTVRNGDFRILAHKVFRKAEDVNKIILPISFDETREAAKLNLQTRKDALNYLDQGGCIGIFPGGTVSTSAKPMGTPLDPTWRNFTAKMIQQSNATVIPVYFDGSNSRLFQIASHAHYTLRMALLIREFKKQKKGPIKMVIGDPIPREKLDAYKNSPKEMMTFLRAETYALSPTPIDASQQGFEFEEHYR